jgi:hypothetical protein
MDVDPDASLKEAVAQFYNQHGFPGDGGIGAQRWSPVGCRDLKVYLPNFEWRRRALPFHDIHHVLTGYPFRPTGEFEMAAWEFAAGRYPNPLSTLFCLPLVSLGTCTIPRRSFSAFVRGRHSQTLYRGYAYPELLERRVAEVRAEILPSGPVVPTPRHYFEYLALVACSASVIALPLIAITFALSELF